VSADASLGHSNDVDSYRLAACTLIIGAPVGKNKVRMVDGKIENLWLKGEETAERLDNIRMLATLLNSVQKFCAGHEIPHLSSIQKADHPAWLRDFFTVAGFDRCECLKPEAGGQRYRACLKLNNSGQAVEQRSGQNTSSTQIEKEEAVSRKDESAPPAPTAPANKQTTKLSATANGLNSASGSSALKPAIPKPFTPDQALEWLSQNKEILSPLITSTGPTNVPAHNASLSQGKAAADVSMVDSRAADRGEKLNGEKLNGEKRKREEPIPGLQQATTDEGNSKSRKDQNKSFGEQRIKQTPLEKEQQPRPRSESKASQVTATRYSFTMAPEPKIATSKETKSTNMTDALLAQCTKTSSEVSPKKVKKDVPTVPSAFTTPIDEPPRWASNLPPKSLTCFYWYNQGACKHRDEDCTYAHWDTGNVARPPGNYNKKPKSSRYGQYDGEEEHWSDVNGINIKGTHDASGGAPTGPKSNGLSHGILRHYDSWRPS